MTLHDLAEQLMPEFPPSVQKDLKTAVRMLAQAFGYTDPKSCPLEACQHPLPEIYHMIIAYLADAGKSAHTIRNVKNNLSRLFRVAHQRAPFSPVPISPVPAQLIRRFPRKDQPPRFSTPYSSPDGSMLPRRLWPVELESAFSEFVKWASDPVVPGREARWKKRAITLASYQQTFESYFGYLTHIVHIEPVTFDLIYDFKLIERFVMWHINEKWKRPTSVAFSIIKQVHTIARQYHPDPSLVESLTGLRRRLPKWKPFHDKTSVWIPLRELDRVGKALWPSKTPHMLHSSGRRSAVHAGASLMLRLWVHIPYRQRNIREMKFEQNLYRTPEGQWRIRFAGEEMKIASKRGRTNVFDLPFPPTLVETLESYRETWRPILTRGHDTREVFLTMHGQPYGGTTLREVLQGIIYSYTGKHWHPHIVRTVWATEWIKTHGDFYTAAIMLNDRLETVIQNYAHLMEEDVAEKAYEWVQGRIDGH